MLPSNNTLVQTPSTKDPRSKSISDDCHICGVPALYSYFGVLSCSSCKMFFKRNAPVKQSSFVCDYDGNCEINIKNRHICASCRLAKCFQCGMTTDKFRSARSARSNKICLQKTQSERLPPLNLLETDQSLLTTDQWTLLSHLTHSYQESQLLSIAQRLIFTHNSTESNDVMYKSLVQEFLASTYESTGSYLRSNDDLRKLSSNDRSIMVRCGADNVSCIGWNFIMHHCHLFTLAKFANILAKLYGQRSNDLHCCAAKFIDDDIVLVKLAISLFGTMESTYSYSPDELSNSIDILHIQNKYAEITWKYLLYKCGYHQTIKRFVNLVNWLMAMTLIINNAQHLALHVGDVNALVEQTELTLILDDVDDILETNS